MKNFRLTDCCFSVKKCTGMAPTNVSPANYSVAAPSSTNHSEAMLTKNENTQEKHRHSLVPKKLLNKLIGSGGKRKETRSRSHSASPVPETSANKSESRSRAVSESTSAPHNHGGESGLRGTEVIKSTPIARPTVAKNSSPVKTLHGGVGDHHSASASSVISGESSPLFSPDVVIPNKPYMRSRNLVSIAGDNDKEWKRSASPAVMMPSRFSPELLLNERLLRVLERMKAASFRSRLKQIVKYNSVHPLEQSWVFLPLTILLGNMVKYALIRVGMVRADDLFGFHGMPLLLGLLWYVVGVVAIWFIQERLCLASFRLKDPFVDPVPLSVEVTVESTPQVNNGDRAADSHVIPTVQQPPETINNQQREKRADDIHHQHEFKIKKDDRPANESRNLWTFDEYIKEIPPQKKLTSDQETMVNTLIQRFFDKRSDIWSRSKYLCVNDDPRSGAVRALIARRWNVKDAIELIEQNLEWRLRERIDEIFSLQLPSDDLESIRRHLHDGFYGVDHAGYPIWFCPAGSVDLNALKAEVPLGNLLVYHIQCMEFNQRVWFKELSMRQNRPVYQVDIVLDLKGFGLHTVRGAFWECLELIGNPDRDYYYENVHRLYIINAPTFFRFFWRTLSPLFDPDTRLKFNFLRSAKDLEHVMDMRIIPEEFGGRYKGSRPILYDNQLHGSVYADHFDAFMRDWRMRRRIEVGTGDHTAGTAPIASMQNGFKP